MVGMTLSQIGYRYSSERLMVRLRLASFRACLRADVSYFDDERHAASALTSEIADNAKKVDGLTGSTVRRRLAWSH